MILSDPQARLRRGRRPTWTPSRRCRPRPPRPRVAELLLEIGCEEMPAPWLPGPRRAAARRASRMRPRASSWSRRTRRVAWTPRRLVLRADAARAPGRSRGAGLGPVAQGGEGRRRGVDGAAQGFAKKNGVAAEALLQRPKDAAKPGELNLLFVKKIAGRATGEVLPGVLSRGAARARVPEAHELGRLARGRQGRLPVRPADPLAGRAPRRQGRCRSRSTRSRRAPRARSSWRAAPRRAAIASCRAARPERPVRVSSFAELRDAAARALRAARARGARRADRRRAARGRRGPRVRRPRPASPSGATSSSTRRCVVGQRARGVPRRCRPRCSRRCSSTTRSTSRSRRGRRGRRASRPSTNGDGAAARGDRARHGARGGGAPARRVVLLRRGPEAPARRARRGPRRRHVPPGARHLQGQGRRAWCALVDAMGAARPAGRASTRPPRRTRRGSPRPTSTTLMVREFPELQGVMGGIYLAASGAPADVATAVRWHYHPVSIEAGRRAGRRRFAGRTRRARLRGGLARRQARHAGRLLRPRREPDGQQRPLRPAPRRRRARCACCSTSGGRRRGRSLRTSRRWWRTRSRATAALKQPPRRRRAERLERSCSTASRYVLTARGFAADEVEAVLGAREPDALDDPHRGAACACEALHARAPRGGRDDFAAPGRSPSSAPRTSSRRRRPARPWTRRCSRPTPSARSSRRSARLGQDGGGLRGAPARAGGAARAGRPLLRRRARDGRGRARAREPPRPASDRRSRSSTASRTFPGSEEHRDPVRLLLRRRQGGRQQGHEGHARRQGRRPRRDDERRPAGAARLHDLDRGLQRSTTRAGGKLPAEVDAADRRGARALETLDGQEARRRRTTRCSSRCAAARSSRCPG